MLEKVTKKCKKNINCGKERENTQLMKNCRTTVSTDTWAKIKKIIFKIWHKNYFLFKT